MRVAIGRASEAIERKQWIFCRGSANPRYEKAMFLYRIRVSEFAPLSWTSSLIHTSVAKSKIPAKRFVFYLHEYLLR
jgi:hypothetical protein